MATDRAQAQDIHIRRLRWRSRRGMLELELVLAPFVDTRLHELSTADQALYEKLLDHDDWDIFEWIQGRRDIPDPELVRIVDDIRTAAAP